VRAEHSPTATVIYLEGEIDLSNTRLLARELADARGDVIVDLAGTKFLDGSAIRILEEEAERCKVTGRAFVLTRTPPLFRRIFEILGDSTPLRHAASLEEAVRMSSQKGVESAQDARGGLE
jgi:anti-anti-sigma factor